MLSVRFAILFLFTMALLVSSSVLAEQRISLRERVNVDHQDVTLNDVADLTSSEMSTLMRLRSVSIGRISEKNVDVSIGRVEIMNWVIQKLGRLASDAEWGGASQTSIHFSGSSFKENQKIVNRDSWLTLRVRSGLVTVECRVIALQSGSAGQFIRVKKTNVTGSLLAKIIDVNTVEIVE